jgi:aarF domain-containing kinase
MVKFYKPTTSFLLKNIFAALFNTSTPSDPIHTNTTVVADSESDLIVSHLSSLSHDRTAWLEALTNLSDQGYQPELVFLDSGLVTTLNAHDRKNFIELFRAIATFDGYKAGKLMVERCRSPELAVDPETFALKMQHLVLSVKSQTFSLGRIKISDILVEVLKAVRTHHVKMEADFINTVLSILLLEGIGRQLDPDMDLFKSVLPILRQVGRQMSAKEVKDEFSRDGGGGTMFKIWVYLEARELASAAAFASADEMMRYDW